MNKVYKHIWSKTQGRLVVVSECARGARGRKSGRRKLAAGLMASTLFSAVAWANDLPSGGQIVSGTGTIASNGNTLTVNQSTDRLIANWQSFSIGENNAVTFNQPGASSVALNRVVGQDPSQILGNLNANGQVFLLNPNGIAIGNTGSVQTGGFVASTLEMSNEDFLSGTYRFKGIGGTITNQGTINGNVVALIAPSVTNEGTLTGGSLSNSATGVALAAGTDVLLDFDGDGLLSVEVKANTLAGLVENNGLIQADGGVAILTAKGASDALKGVVNNTGTVQAQTLAKKDGRILLLGDMDNGEVNVAGTLDASAPADGDGGFIETSAAKVRVSEDVTITTQSADGHTGTWLIDPNDYTIAATGGDITGATLSSQLGSNNVIIESVNGATDGNGDIFVNDTVSWSANTLTLNAERNIEINTEMNASGTAGLALEYNQADGGSDYIINAPVNLAATGSFSTQDGNAGSVIDYTIITSLGAEGSTTGTDLQGIDGDLAGHYVLGADIDASATADWNSGEGFDSLGSLLWTFTGNFDGLGHTISDLTINRPTENYSGLFSYTEGATISNVGLVGGSVTGDRYVGGLVGYNDLSSTINNVYTTGSVTGSSRVGGLVGENYTSTINNAHTTGNVTGSGGRIGGLVGTHDSSTINNAYASGSVASTGSSNSVGGLVGASSNSNINNAYATGSVTTSGDYVGGLVGFSDETTISNAFATGSVTSGGDYIGGLVGYNFNTTITNSFWNTETSNQLAGIGEDNNSQTVTGLTTSEMLNFANYAGFDSSIWSIKEGETSAYLSAFDRHSVLLSDGTAYLSVQTLDELQAINSNLDSNYALFNDLDASATSGWNSGEGFDPLGDYDTRFTGQFDGLGHTLSDLTINRPTEDYVGLFGYTHGATISNVGLVGGSVTGKRNVGGLVGYNNASTIDNAYTTGSVSGNGDNIGGLVGGNTNSSTISNAYATGDVSGNSRVGGLVGINSSSGISDTYATGSVSGSGTYIGGLVGRNYNATVTGSFWNLETTTQTSGFGVDNNGQATTGLTTAQMQDPFIFIDAGWDFASVWGKSSAGENNGYMMLRGVGDGTLYNDYVRLSDTNTAKTYGDANPELSGITLEGVGTGNITLAWNDAMSETTNAGNYAYGTSVLDVTTTSANGVYVDYGSGALIIDKAALSVTANDANKTYDGLAFTGGNGVTYTGFVNGETDSVLAGSLTYGGDAQDAVNAGSYDLTASGLTADNYEIAYTDGTLIVDKAALSVTTNDANKTYDGLAFTGGNDVSYEGFVTGEDDSVLGGSLTFEGDAQNAVNAGSYTIVASGQTADNYDISYVDGALTVDKAALTLASTDVTKTYDGTTSADGTAIVTAGELFGDDSLSDGTFAFTDANVGTGKTVTLADVTVTDGNGGGNYSVVYADNTTSTIDKAMLSVTASDANKTYDGLAFSGGNGVSYDGFVGGENESVLGGSLAYGGAAQNAVNAGSYTLTASGLTSGNYDIAYTDGALKVDKAGLSVTANDATKTYDGLAFNGGNGISFDGFVAGEDDSVLSGTLAYGGDAQNAVNAGSYALSASGLTSGNYDVNYVDGTLTVNKAVISAITGLTASDKIYDGTTAATLDTSGAGFTDMISGDSLSVATATGAFTDKNAGTGKTVNISGLSLGGDGAANYVLADVTAQTSAAIFVPLVTTHLLPEQINRISLSGFDGRTDTLLNPGPELIEIQATSDNPSDG